MKSVKMICLGLAVAFALGFVSTVMTPVETCAEGGCPARECCYMTFAERRPDMDYICLFGEEAWYVEHHTYNSKYDECTLCKHGVFCYTEDPPCAPNEPDP